jgi:hypothetical protein
MIWGLLGEEGRARWFMATRKGAVLVKSGFSEELGDAFRSLVHLDCMYFVIYTAFAHTARGAGEGGGPTRA